MGMLDSLKSAASWATSKIEPDVTGIHINPETTNLNTAIANSLPGFSNPDVHKVADQPNTYRDTKSGVTYKDMGTSTIAQSILGNQTTPLVEQDAQIAKPQPQPQKTDSIFTYVPQAEWQKVLRESNAQNQQATPSDKLPGVQLEVGKGNLSPEQSVKIVGDKHIHTDSDGTVTTQIGGSFTEIVHLGHTILKDTKQGTLSDLVGNRVAFSENTLNHTQQWNTKQGVHIVQEGDEYKVYDAQGNLIARRPVSLVASEVAQQETLVNGEQMKRHIGDGALDQAKADQATIALQANGKTVVSASGVEWDVYQDGVTRTLDNGTAGSMTAGLMKTGDAFVREGQVLVVRKGRGGKFFMIDGEKASEIDGKDDKLNAFAKNAVLLLSRLSDGGKLQFKDGTFLTIRDGQVVGGEDKPIVDEPVVSPSAVNTAPSILPTTVSTAAAPSDAAVAGTAAGDKQGPQGSAPKTVEISMVTSAADASTAVLLGGYHERFEWKSQAQTISAAGADAMGAALGKGIESPPKPDDLIVKFEATPEGPKVTTADVVTTTKGTTDLVTGDFFAPDTSFTAKNGTHITRDGDASFGDGTTFYHDGRVKLADGKMLSSGSSQASDAVISQAAAAASQAQGVAAMVAGKAGSGSVTMADIAALQDCIGNVNALVGVCMNAGNLELAQSLMGTGAGLEGALNGAMASFTRNTTFRATGLTSVNSVTSPAEEGRYNSMRYKFAA